MNTKEKISIKINGKKIESEKNKTIFQVALNNKINIPCLCFHPDTKTKNYCGLCIIETGKQNKIKKAHSCLISDGMEIVTESKNIQETRRKNLEKILEKHLLECDDCVWFQNCKLLKLSKLFKTKPIIKKNKNDKVLQVGSIVFDQTKCIGCGNCLGVCPTKFLSLNKRKKINLSENKNKNCISCGQCILHCPVGAIEGVGEFESLNKVFQDRKKITVVQFAPAIRTSISEEFNIRNQNNITGKLISALKQVGFDYVFDTALGADFTTIEESQELIDRITKNEKLPGITSCCPAWVNFLEFYYPEFIPKLCSARSPQTMLGGIIKTYWSQKKKINPKNIFVVSVMPCVAKKNEIKKQTLKLNNGNYPVDMILTTRELARLLKSKKINLKDLQESELDSLLGEPSGAGVIYGASGGVIESALRTAYFKITNKEMDYNEIKQVRGANGIKKKEIIINNRLIKICVISGIKNAIKELEKIKKNPKLYDALEVMACPGGCIGGGGQPLPSNKKIIEKRGQLLYQIDKNKKVRRAHQNPSVKKVYTDFFNDKNRKNILHTSFSRRKRESIIKLKNSKETK